MTSPEAVVPPVGLTHTSSSPPPATSLARLSGNVLGWLIALAAFVNAAAYIAYAGNPLVSSDAWYFIDAFLRKAMESGATLQDYYVKRSPDDHAQPVLKLLLLANAEWFGLDFVFEAMMGLLFAALSYLVMVRAVFTSPGALGQGWQRGLALGTLAACLVTLNAGMVFNWSLVTLVYFPYLLATLGGLCAWRVVGEGRGTLALVVSALAIAFLLDGMGLLISFAIVLATGLYAVRNPVARSRGVRVVAVFATAEIFYLLLSRLLLTPQVAMVVEGGAGANAIASLWAIRSEWWEVARIVFGSTMAHVFTLTHFAGDAARQWHSLLAVLAMALHAWFWLSAWRMRWNAVGFIAMALMLLFYGLVAGILITRVPMNGINYLLEPRYVVFYLLGNVSIVLMFLARPAGDLPGKRARVSPMLMVVGLLLLLQLPLSRFTWWDGQYLNKYYHSMAAQTYFLGEGQVPANCVALVVACQMPEPTRKEAMRFLKEHRLNLYSQAFVERYRLESLAPE